MSESIAILQKERDEARAACAEMRYSLETISHQSCVLDHPDECSCCLKESPVIQMADDALSKTDAGKGWLSPEKKAKVRKLLELVDLCCAEINGWDSIDGDEVKEALKLLEIE